MAESKTFIEVWEGLDKAQRGDLRARVIGLTHISDVTFWKWVTGKSRPGSFPMEHAVMQATNDVLGSSYTRQQLFP